ncbi:MAG: hypothetical protein KGJ23_05120 [Euryarchaeota archaeon]|nr:hypothetical protein [Euryarchaeota archaeon]MDE1835980.1 hypothetical protein [Euryarchaeota archaeon]MDE1880978.1 hypothetical protein [Euryarchaeota archaeon]MDE2046028.1 hypothetical protein [Thermoplasmata archaeon]
MDATKVVVGLILLSLGMILGLLFGFPFLILGVIVLVWGATGDSGERRMA